jgi:hypothetical protein
MTQLEINCGLDCLEAPMALTFPTKIANDPSKKGQLAARKQFFGEYRRYAVAPIHTRFDAVEWFVWDAAQAADGELAPVIRQEATLAEAVAGLLDGEEIAA